ncbi:hypothetical protein ACKVMT_16350 [Halobacteriales archaeon Cl-PHB]
MGATVYLEDPIDGREAIDCEEVCLRGNVAWLTPSESGRQLVVPVDNVTGMAGDDVEEEVDALPTQGGQYNEVVTWIR